MKYNSRTVIEITDRNIKLFQSSLTGNHSLTFGGMISLENLTDEDIAHKLLELCKSKRFNLNNSRVTLVIPRHYVILRYLDLPSENKDELRSMVDLQAVNHLPYTREELIVDFIPLDKNVEGYTKVLVVAVPLETVLRFERILESARMVPHQITTSFIGQWQWYLNRWSSQAGVTVILDIDSKRTEICICDQTKVLISRPTTLGIKEIDAKDYDEFLKQLDWTMASYVKEQLGPPIAQIFVVSSMSSLEELKEQIQKHYTMTVYSVKSLQDVPLKKSFAWPALLLKEWSSVTALLGVLQSDFDSTIDLTPSSVRSTQSFVETKNQGIRLGVVGLLAIGCFVFCLSLNFFKQNAQLSYLEKEIKDAQKQVLIIKKKKRQLTSIKNVVEGRIVMIDVIREIYKSVPESVVLTNLTLTQEQNLSLQGYTNRAIDVNDMQKSLVASSYFDTVNLDYVNKRVTLDGEVNYFKVTCHIKLKAQHDEEA